MKEKEAAEETTQKPSAEEKAEKTVAAEESVAPLEETVKNPGNMKPRRVAMLDMADKEGKKKVGTKSYVVTHVKIFTGPYSQDDL